MLQGQEIRFNKVVIWGHKLHSHTHSYIHSAFYKAFKYLGYDTYWIDNKENVKELDFSNTLFITEGQADDQIPLLEDCFYILHNCDSSKYKSLIEKKRVIFLQVYTDDVLSRPTLIKVAPCIYYDLAQRRVYLPWASDLLPDEIEKNKVHIDSIRTYKVIGWVGTIGGGTFGNLSELQPFIERGKELKYNFSAQVGLSDKLNCKFIQQVALAPAIVGSWQKAKGYIPCRIFKNISYGKMGITNSIRVNELFDDKLIFDSDPRILFDKALAFIKERDQRPIYELMDFVKQHHTYLNRIEIIFDFIKKLED